MMTAQEMYDAELISQHVLWAKGDVIRIRRACTPTIRDLEHADRLVRAGKAKNVGEHARAVAVRRYYRTEYRALQKGLRETARLEAEALQG